MQIKSKVFLDIIQDHAKNPKRVKKILASDKRLSHSEKMIVQGFLLMRDNKNSEALAMVEEISIQSDNFVEGMRQYLLAGVLNNLGHYQKALKHFKICHEIFPKNQVIHLEFVILYNIYNVHFNLHHYTVAHETIKTMRRLKGLNEEDSLRLLRASFWCTCMMEKAKEATIYFQALKKMTAQFINHDFVSLQRSFFYYGLVFQKYEICYDALNEMRTQKKHAQSQNYNYMKLLLDHLIEDKPIYLVESEYKNHQQLLWELKAIRALDNHKKEEFILAWKYLHSQNPETFLKNETYKGLKSLFSECLKRHQDKLQRPEMKQIKDQAMPVLEALELKLKEAKGITREDLFYFLYGRQAETKDELNRISKYINRLKNEKDLNIHSKRGLYSLAA